MREACLTSTATCCTRATEQPEHRLTPPAAAVHTTCVVRHVWGKLKKLSFPLNDHAEWLKQEVPSRKALWAQLAGPVQSPERGDVTGGSGVCPPPPRPPLSAPSRLARAAEEGINPWLQQQPHGPAPPAQPRGPAAPAAAPAAVPVCLTRPAPGGGWSRWVPKPSRLSARPPAAAAWSRHTRPRLSSAPGPAAPAPSRCGGPGRGARGAAGGVWWDGGAGAALTERPGRPHCPGLGVGRAGPGGRDRATEGQGRGHPRPRCRTPPWPGDTRAAASDCLGDRAENRSAPRSQCWTWHDCYHTHHPQSRDGVMLSRPWALCPAAQAVFPKVEFGQLQHSWFSVTLLDCCGTKFLQQGITRVW